MSFDKITDIDLFTLNDKDYLSFISKRNKIHEEIKDYVIDRFINKIYEQSKEIFQLKKKLDETIKNSLLIIKKCFLKKKFFPVNQINLSYLKNNNKKEKINKITFGAGNVQNQHKTYQKNNKINANCLYTINKINLKKFLKPKKSFNQNQTNKINNSNISKKFGQYSVSLDVPCAYRNFSRNNIYYNKDSTLISEQKYDTCFMENNNKVEPFNGYNIIKNNNTNSLYEKKQQQKVILSHSKNNTICNQNSFFGDNCLKINNFRINNNKQKNKIKIINNGLFNNSNNIQKCKSKNVNCFKKLNLTNIIFNNNHNQNNSILHYCQTDRTIKNGGKIKNIYIDYKNIPLSTKNNKITNENCISISHHSVPNNHFVKLNKISFKIKEINKLYDTQNYSQKTERPRKKLNTNDIHNINITNYLSMTDRFLSNKKKDEYKLETKKEIKTNNIKTNLHKKGKKYSININEFDNNNNNKDKSFKTLYNPTFTTFLNRTMTINNGKTVKKINYIMNNNE